MTNSITQADGNASVKVRATLPINLTLNSVPLDGAAASQSIHRDVSLYGPGDIVGIDARAVIKVDPHNWITNFEPNYLPYIEFYDEDFPWRYVPAAADGGTHRLRPWIALVVLKESEFAEGKNIQGKPLAYFDLAADVFPPAAELWAWAHVHVNTDLSEVLFVFDEQDKLVGLRMTFPKGPMDQDFENLLGYLSAKYPLVRKEIPFVGDKSARLKLGDVVIEAYAPHLSFTMAVLYMTMGFEQAIEAGQRQEAASKKKRESAQF